MKFKITSTKITARNVSADTPEHLSVLLEDALLNTNHARLDYGDAHITGIWLQNKPSWEIWENAFCEAVYPTALDAIQAAGIFEEQPK